MDAMPPAGPNREPNPYEPPRVARTQPGRPVSCLGHFLGAVAAVLAGLVAFVGTCMPIAFAPEALGASPPVVQIVPLLGCVIGVFVALRVATGVSRRLLPARQRPLPPSDDGDPG